MQMPASEARHGGVSAQNGQRPALSDLALTLASTVHRQLEAEIAEGRIEPGTRLDEQEVAARFGVSRTPVREAFRLLAADDLVELRGRQGAAVRVIGVHTLIEMFQVMGELEGLCARLAARRLDPGAARRDRGDPRPADRRCIRRRGRIL